MRGRKLGTKNEFQNKKWDSILFEVKGDPDFITDENKQYVEYKASTNEFIRFNSDLTVTYIIYNHQYPMQELKDYYTMYRYIQKLLSEDFDYTISCHLKFIGVDNE